MDRKETHIHEVEITRKPFTIQYTEGKGYGYPIVVKRTRYYGTKDDFPVGVDFLHITKQQVGTLIEVLQEIQKEWIK